MSSAPFGKKINETWNKKRRFPFKKMYPNVDCVHICAFHYEVFSNNLCILYVWSVTQVCFGISIPNFICNLFVGMGRSLLIFSDVTFKMAAWRPYWIFRFPDYNFSLPMNIKSKLHWHITCVYGKKYIDFQLCHFQNGRLVVIFDFSSYVL